MSKNKVGALGRNRTGTGLPPPDFKSDASTCSATRAFHHVLHIFAFKTIDYDTSKYFSSNKIHI